MKVTMAVGSALSKALNAYVPQVQVELIGNIVHDQLFTLAEAPPQPPFVISAVGLLEAHKGFHVLLEAFASAFRGQAAQLNIAGTGKLRSELEKRVLDLHLSNQVAFLGPLKRPEVRDLFHGSHVIVSSSLVETFGVTLIEAMACGRPVVATRSGGPEGFVTPEVGLLVPPSDVAALADALRTLQSTYNKYDAAQIRNYCVTNFGEAAYVSRLVAFYEQAQQATRLEAT
jgi:glycosyltransferase involved in cell wall biosynthesis